MATLSKGCKPDNFESHNSLKHRFMKILGLCLNFAKCESLLESNSPDILLLYETNLDDSIDSGNFSVGGYLAFIRKDYVTHMHGLSVYVKEFLLLGTYLWKTLQILTYVFNWLYFTQCLISFSSIDHLLYLYAQFLMIFHLA